MAIFYKKVQRVNPSDTKAAKKWYPVLKSIGQVGEKEVAKELADETTLNPKEAEMALSQFEKILRRYLLNGYTVQLGDWGSFMLTIGSEGSDKIEEVTANKIKKVKLRFRPGKDLQEALDKATFKDVAELSSK